MINKILIIDGIDSTDELPFLGINTAERYAEADKVFIITNLKEPKQIKYAHGEDLTAIYYLDAKEELKKNLSGE